MSADDAEALESPDAFPNTRHGKRDRAFVLIGLLGGLRAVETRRLRWSEVDDRRRGVLAWNRKNHLGQEESRFVPLPDLAWEALDRLPRNGEWCFPGAGGGQMSSRGAHRLVNDACMDALGFHVTPHMLRHTCANRLVRRGVELDVVQRVLGHAWLSTTGIYLHPTDDDVATAMRG